jgi:radical SAM superfamily enzyme YgiQ (UPF0313 family)
MKQTSVLLVTPPFTQLNTPYPATAYLKGFLNTHQISSYQIDLGLEVTLELFSVNGLTELFDSIESQILHSENAHRIFNQRHRYIEIISSVIRFLQGKDSTLAYLFSQPGFLPQAARFEMNEFPEELFGQMGIQDKAKHLCTLFLEDLSDFIQENKDPHFGFSRYAEQLARSANTFDEIEHQLKAPLSWVDDHTIKCLNRYVHALNPKLIVFTAPFPGNIFSAFRCAQMIRQDFPEIQIALGGGFANTELRQLSDVRVFDYMHFVCLDDGEIPLLNIWEYINHQREIWMLRRTFVLQHEKVEYINGSLQADVKQDKTGTPDYSDLKLKDYISVLEISNPMHRLWTDGRWNKLTMAHGCYWGKCTFCDITLPYISDYEPNTAAMLCDRMEEIMQQTGESGFHFVDEAAPPALMRELALEIIQRGLILSWWANIRFEKTFSRDLCHLLHASGCVAVSGGLEVASDRLLQLIDKGVSVEQVALVTKNFTEAGILVHAYLMYAYPTQTVQETIDSLEMVRQMFEAGILKSGFWHHFALTVHSPIAKDPKKYGISIDQKEAGSFANNDLLYRNHQKVDHEQFSEGLKKSLFNYMHGLMFEKEVHLWFDSNSIPKTRIDKNYILNILNQETLPQIKPGQRIIWLGQMSPYSTRVQSKKGMSRELVEFTIRYKGRKIEVSLMKEVGLWIYEKLHSIQGGKTNALLSDWMKDYADQGLEDFDLFWFNKPMSQLYRFGLIAI